MTRGTNLIWACVLSASVFASACDGGADEGAPANTAPPAANAPGASLTVTGCLQRSGLHYVLTQVNEPGHPAGESAQYAQADQVLAAIHSYRLESEDAESLVALLGKRVRVTGHIGPSGAPSSEGTAGQREVGTRGDQRRSGNVSDPTDGSDLSWTPTIDRLTELRVRAIDEVSATCGG